MYHWYLQAIKQAKNSKFDKVLEPIYIFCSTLVKNLYRGKLDAKSVELLLANEKEINTESASEDDIIYMGSSTDIEPNVAKELSQYSQHLSPDIANAYHAIFQRIMDIRNADTKGWHHRPVYRVK